MLAKLELSRSLRMSGVVALLSLSVRLATVLALGAWASHLPQPALRLAVITAAMAPGVNTYLFANLYGHARDVTGSAVLSGTLTSVILASIWISILAG